MPRKIKKSKAVSALKLLLMSAFGFLVTVGMLMTAGKADSRTEAELIDETRTPRQANTLSTPLDFTSASTTSGTGYTWDSTTKTLTLTALTLKIDTPTTSATNRGYGIKLPANSTVVCSGSNTIDLINSGSNLYFDLLLCEGDLTLLGADSSTSNKLNVETLPRATTSSTGITYKAYSVTGVKAGNITIGNGSDYLTFWSYICELVSPSIANRGVVTSGKITVNSGIPRFYASSPTPNVSYAIEYTSSSGGFTVNGSSSSTITACTSVFVSPTSTTTTYTQPILYTGGVCSDMPAFAYGNASSSSSANYVPLKFNASNGNYVYCSDSTTVGNVVSFNNPAFSKTSSTGTLTAKTAGGSLAYVYDAKYLQYTTVSQDNLAFFTDSTGTTETTAPDATQLTITVTDSSTANTIDHSAVNISFASLATTKALTYYFKVRMKDASSGNYFSSSLEKFTVAYYTGGTAPTAPSSSDFSVDYANEKLVGYDTSETSSGYMEYSTSSDFSTVGKLDLASSVSDLFPASGSAAQTVYIRRNDGYHEPSTAASISLAARQAAPSASAFSTSTTAVDSSKVTVNGVADTMEYSTDNGTTWTAVPTGASSLTATSGQSLLFRTKATATSPASVSTAYTASVIYPDPAAVIDYSAEKLTGLLSGVTYDISGTQYTADADGKIAVLDSWWGQSLTLKAVGDATHTDSVGTQSLTLTKRQTSPSVSNVTFEKNPSDATHVILDGVDETMEYSTDGGTTWTAVSAGSTSISVAAGASVALRTKATSTAPCSASVAYQAPSIYADPSAAIDYANEKITGLLPGVAYDINGTSYTADADGKISLTGFLGKTVVIKAASDASHTASLNTQSFEIAARPSTPAALTLTPDPDANGKITVNGFADGQEYSTDGGTTWTAVPTGTTSLKFAPSATVTVRVQATATAPCSDSSSQTLPSLPSTPNAEADYANLKLTGLTSGSTYIIEGSEYTADANGKVTLLDSWLGKDISIVLKGSKVNSLPQTLTMEAKAQILAPNQTSGETEISDYYDSVGDTSSEAQTLKTTYVDSIKNLDISTKTVAELRAQIASLVSEAKSKLDVAKVRDDALAYLQSQADTETSAEAKKVLTDAIDTIKNYSNTGSEADKAAIDQLMKEALKNCYKEKAAEQYASYSSLSSLSETAKANMKAIEDALETSLSSYDASSSSGSEETSALKNLLAEAKAKLEVEKTRSDDAALLKSIYDMDTTPTAGQTSAYESYLSSIESLVNHGQDSDKTELDKLVSEGQKAMALARISDYVGSFPSSSEKVKSIVTDIDNEIDSAIAQGGTKEEIQTRIEAVIKEGLAKVEFQETVDQDVAKLKDMDRTCTGSKEVSTIIEEAVEELEKSQYGSVTIDQVNQIYKTAVEKATVKINDEVMPSRLDLDVSSLTSSYDYSEADKDEIEKAVAEAKTKIAAATTSQEQQDIYDAVVEKIFSVQTDKAVSTAEGTAYGPDYDYSTDGLIGSVSADGYDGKARVTISLSSTEQGKTAAELAKKDYVIDLSVTSNEQNVNGPYDMSILLPKGYDLTSDYYVQDSSGHLIRCQVSSDGHLTFHSDTLGTYTMMTDYKQDYLTGWLYSLLALIIAESVCALVELNKLKKMASKKDGTVKASVCALPAFLVLTTVIAKSAMGFLISEIIIAVLLLGLDILLWLKIKKEKKDSK